VNAELLDVDTTKWIPDTIALATYRRCKAYAVRRRCQEHTAHDFASWAVCEVIEGRAPNPRWLLVDYMRTLMGRVEAPNAQVRQAIHSPISFETPIGDNDESTFFEVLCGRAGEESDWHQMLRSKAMERALKVKDACLVVAHFAYGVTQKELGDSLSLSESRINQRIKGALRRMNDALEGRIVELMDDGETAEAIAATLKREGLSGPGGEEITEEIIEAVFEETKTTRRKIEVNVDELKIEKGVDLLPSGTRKNSKFRDFMAKLEPGDSFVASADVGKKAAGAAKSLKFKIAVRKLDDGRARIWRLQ
jgi:DNA-directed RNA polymerase specialized sigma24 family protein